MVSLNCSQEYVLSANVVSSNVYLAKKIIKKNRKVKSVQTNPGLPYYLLSPGIIFYITFMNLPYIVYRRPIVKSDFLKDNTYSANNCKY